MGFLLPFRRESKDIASAQQPEPPPRPSMTQSLFGFGPYMKQYSRRRKLVTHDYLRQRHRLKEEWRREDRRMKKEMERQKERIERRYDLPRYERTEDPRLPRAQERADDRYEELSSRQGDATRDARRQALRSLKKDYQGRLSSLRDEIRGPQAF